MVTAAADSAVPEVLKPLAGRIMDADSHEYTPVNHWEEQFGSAVRPSLEAPECSKMQSRAIVEADDSPADPDDGELVWM